MECRRNAGVALGAARLAALGRGRDARLNEGQRGGRASRSARARARVEIEPLLRLAVPGSGEPYRLATGQRSQYGRGDIVGQRQGDAVRPLDAVAILES